MKAIRTRYLPATNFKPSRIVAEAEPYNHNRVVIPYESGLNSDENHREAAIKLATKRKWAGVYVEGHLAEGSVWVNLGHSATFTSVSSSSFMIEKE